MKNIITDESINLLILQLIKGDDYMYPIKTNKLVMTSGYGKRTYTLNGKKVSDFHHGIDLVGGTDILATADGVVTKTVKIGKKGGTMCQVRIRHKDYETAYYHLKSGSITVNVGDTVKQGQKIAEIGDTGKVTGKHLHYQIDRGSNSTSINPYDYVFKNKTFPKPEKKDDTSKELLLMVKKTIRGDYGNGASRKRALGKYYDEVQYQVAQNVKHGTTNWNNIKLY